MSYQSCVVFYFIFIVFFVAAPLLISGALKLSFFADNYIPKEPGYSGKYLAGILSAVVQFAGADRAAEIWRAGQVLMFKNLLFFITDAPGK